MEKGPIIDFWTKVLDGNIRLFAAGAEAELFRFVCDRTLRWGKFSERIVPLVICETGSPSIGLLPMCWKRDTLRKRRAALVKKNLIFYKDNWYVVNMPGIWRELNYLFAPVVVGWKKYQVSFNDIYSEFKAAGYPPDMRCKVNEDIARLARAGKQQSIDSKIGKAKKVEPIDPVYWKGEDVRNLIISYCAEHDVPCGKRGWTGKDKGCAVNFVKYCLQVDQDPREVLREVCKRWGEYRFKLETPEGKRIELPKAFDFTLFFIHRDKIATWLATHTEVENGGEQEDGWERIDGEQWAKDHGLSLDD